MLILDIHPGKNSGYEPHSISKKAKAMQPRKHWRILAVFADSLQLAGKRGQLIGVPSWKVVPVLVDSYTQFLLLKSCGGSKRAILIISE